MNTIIHDPTRGWLLLTEKWPEIQKFTRPASTGSERYLVDAMFFDGDKKEEFDKAVAHCLSTAIEIAKEDWDAVEQKAHTAWLISTMTDDEKKLLSGNNIGVFSFAKEIFKLGTRGNKPETGSPDSNIVDHHPYTVDAEFVQIGQFKAVNDGKWYDYSLRSKVNIEKAFGGVSGYRQIARLVKAKEEWQPKDPGPAGHFKPTESQDELWDEIVRDCTDPDGFLDIDLARKSFRIERI